jgi:hypothetical protein
MGEEKETISTEEIQNTFNEDPVEEILVEGEVENVIYNED